MDRLAREGVRCAQAFATTSLCSPSRASFLSGRYARSHGILDNLAPLPDALTTLATILSDAGYDSGLFGKWHMGTQKGPRPGFRHFASYTEQGRYSDCVFEIDGRDVPTKGFVDEVATAYALRFLEEPRDGPFLAWVGLKAPHGPRFRKNPHAEDYREVELSAPANARAYPPFPLQAEWDALAEKAGVKPIEYDPPAEWQRELGGAEREPESMADEDLRDYHRLVSCADDALGRLLDKLDELGLAENTIVVYASDNGFLSGEHGMVNKRAAYEESIRIPLLVRYPRLVRAGSTLEELVLNVDLAPTLLDLAGAPVPAAMQGRSLRSLLEGRGAPWREDFVYEYYRELGFAVPTLIALRTARGEKLVVYEDRPEWTELYDLASDPHETVNLARNPVRAADLARLSARLAELDRSLGPRPKRVRMK